MRVARLIAAGAVAAGGVLVFPVSAGAVVSGSGMTCSGNAVITGSDGKTYRIDASDSKADIPRGGSAAYTGQTSPVSHNHGGQIKVQIGPSKVKIYSWSGKNDSNKPGSAGVREMPDLKQAPPGKYELTGFHKAAEGSCSGHITLILKGGLVSTTAGKVAVAGTLLTAAGMVGAAVAKKGKVA